MADIKARVAELEAQGRQLEAGKMEVEEALCKEKHGKESDRCLPSLFCTILFLTCFLFRTRGLHQGQRGVAEAPGGD